MFAQDEGGEGLVGYADVQVNLKDINDNAPIFPQGVYFGNVTENGTAGTLHLSNVITLNETVRTVKTNHKTYNTLEITPGIGEEVFIR